MRFQIIHEFDAPLGAIEKAVLSPQLGPMLAESLSSIESAETVEHVLKDGELLRVLHFQANAPLSIFKGYPVAREALAWNERWTYRFADREADWVILIKEQWRGYFRSEGTYRLESISGGKTRRVVDGDLLINVAVLGRLAERMALTEVRKTYDAEAVTLRRLVNV